MEYELPVHRYRELKHFCLQYKDMKEEVSKYSELGYGDSYSDETSRVAVKLADYKSAIELIEMTAFNVGKFPGEKILEIVTEGKTLGEVCSDTVLADYYVHKFFWLLSEAKGV